MTDLTDVTKTDGSLYSLGWYLCWKVGEATATLDGEFTADDLEAIARHMRTIRRADAAESESRR